MELNWKRVLPALTTALIACAGLHADNTDCCPRPCPPKPCCVPTCCPPVVEDCCNVCPPCTTVTPNGGPCVMNGNDMFITADFLWWGVRQEGLEYAMTPTSPTSTSTTAPSKGKIYHPSTGWNPGFKVGIGTDLDHDGWDLYAQYTWYQAKHHHHHNHSSGTSSSTPTFTTPVVNDAYWFVGDSVNDSVSSYASASEKWKLNFDVLDLEMGRNMYLSPRLQFRPFFGLKGAWQKQHLHLAFNSVPFFGSVGSNYMNNHLKMSGVGVRGGFDTAWHFTRGFSLVGDLAFTGLWEYVKGSRKDTSSTVTGGVTSTPVTNVYISEHCTSVKPILEWAIGLRYEFWTCGDDYHFAFEADWEAQNWFGQNQFIRLPGSANAEGQDLGLQGLTFQVRFDF